MRKYIREVRVRDLVLYFVLPLIFILATAALLVLSCISIEGAFILIPIFASVILFYFEAELFVIGCVLMYKAFAPEALRGRCRFEPCCSTYMILAIKKYGLAVGLIKGIRRILRCKPPNSGVDLP